MRRRLAPGNAAVIRSTTASSDRPAIPTSARQQDRTEDRAIVRSEEVANGELPLPSGRLDRVRVLVADDHPVFRDGLVRAVSGRPELELAGEVSDGRTALDTIRRDAPDVALLDLKLPELD